MLVMNTDKSTQCHRSTSLERSSYEFAKHRRRTKVSFENGINFNCNKKARDLETAVLIYDALLGWNCADKVSYQVLPEDGACFFYGSHITFR